MTIVMMSIIVFTELKQQTRPSLEAGLWLLRKKKKKRWGVVVGEGGLYVASQEYRRGAKLRLVDIKHNLIPFEWVPGAKMKGVRGGGSSGV